MATSPNYGWTEPDDTSLVKDGASAMRTLGNAIDATVYANASAALNKTIIDAKGDLIAGTASDTVARLAIGSNGQVLTADSTASTGIKWSTPVSGSITWTQRANLASGQGFGDLAYNGTNLWVAIGSAGTLLTSSDGITWTARTSGFGAQGINGIAYGGGVWVAVGNNATISSSSDGITWTVRSVSFGSNNFFGVSYGNGNFVAFGQGGGDLNTGGLATSSDGTSWSRNNQSLTVGRNYNTANWNGTNWVIGTNSSTNNYIYASNPASSWTAGATGSVLTVQWIYWDGSQYTTVENGILRFSTSLTLGTTTEINGIFSNSGGAAYYKFYNNKIYTISSGSGMVQSFTPSSTAYGATADTPTLTPIGQISSASPYVSSYAGGIWVGAAGIILTSYTGRIYTSF